jgi:hypothetical protein
MPAYQFTVRFQPIEDDGSFEDITPERIHRALARGFPFLMGSEIAIEDFRKVGPEGVEDAGGK